MFEDQLNVWPLKLLTLIETVPSPKTPLPLISSETSELLLISTIVRSGRLVRQVVVFGVAVGVGVGLAGVGDGVGPPLGISLKL